VNSLVGSGTSNATSRAESVISSSGGVSDSETGTTGQMGSRKESYAQQVPFGPLVIVPMVDIRPPANRETGDKEVVMYSKEVQTSTAWVVVAEEEDGGEEVVKRRVEEEVRKEIERLRVDEERSREEEEKRLEAEKDVPGSPLPTWNIVNGIVISEEEQTRILTSDAFYDFLSRSSKIVERALDEDYDVLVDYTMDVEANQYNALLSQF